MPVPRGRKPYHGAGDLHFITCSCYQRLPLLGTAKARNLFLTLLEKLWSSRKRAEQLRYTHENPAKRGLVEAAAQWRWSSCRFYAYGERGPVRVDEWQVLKMKVRAPAA